MLLPKDYFRDKIRPGTVLDGLLEDGLLQYVVDPEGLKLKLTPEGHDFFADKTSSRSTISIKSLLSYMVLGAFFLVMSCYYRLKFKKG